MPGQLIPSRRIRTGRPTGFAAANPALDFAFLFNIEETGFSRNAARPYGKRHEIMPRPASNGCNGYGYGFCRGDYGLGFAKGSLGRAAGATVNGVSINPSRFQNEASIKLTMNTDEYTILAVVEHAPWMYADGGKPELFSLQGTPAAIYSHPRFGWTNTYLSFGSTSSPAYSDLTPQNETAVPYLVVARFTAGQAVRYSAERLGADPVWRTSNNTAEAVQVTQQFVNTYMGGFPGAIFLGGLSTRLLTDAEVSAISANLGFLFEPEDYFVPSGSGGFDPSHLVGQSSFHIGQAATGAIGVVNLPDFSGSCETQISFVGKRVITGSFAMQDYSSAYAPSIPKRRADSRVAIDTRTSVDTRGIVRRLLDLVVETRSIARLSPRPRQLRRLDIVTGSEVAFSGRRIAAAPFSASCSSSVADDTTAVVGSGMGSESESVLSLSSARMSAARVAIAGETQVDFRAVIEAAAPVSEACVATGTTQIRALTARQEVICLT